MNRQNGKKYIRVTEILSRYTDFSHIEPEVLKKACDRGTEVHRYCELYVKNTLIEKVSEDCKPYFESFVQWYDNVVDELIAVEQRLFCDYYGITGQIDLVVKLKNSEKLYIIDIKTPQQSAKTWALQTAAYKYLFENSESIRVDYRGCLMLDKKGGAPKMIPYLNDGSDKELFFSAYKLYKFFEVI